MKGSEFFKDLNNSREQRVKEWISLGQIPSWFQPTKEIKTSDSSGNTLSYFVTPNYFALGEDSDYVLMPCNPLTFNHWLDANHCILPTKQMVKQIFKASTKIPAFPCVPARGESITNPRLYQQIDSKIKAFLNGPGDHTVNLYAGHKKDVVLSNGLVKNEFKDNVAIYGWWYKNKPKEIQDLNYKDHIVSYVDYSHGLRGVSKECILNGVNESIIEVLKKETLCHLLTDEKLLFLKY